MSSRSRLVSSYKLYSVVGVSFALPCQYVNLGTAHNLGFPLPRELVAGGSLPEYDYSAVFSFIRSAHPSWEPKTGKGFLGDLQEVHDNLEEGLPLPGTPYTLKEYLLPGDVPTCRLPKHDRPRELQLHRRRVRRTDFRGAYGV
jgi:hypothetical protein